MTVLWHKKCGGIDKIVIIRELHRGIFFSRDKNECRSIENIVPRAGFDPTLPAVPELMF